VETSPGPDVGQSTSVGLQPPSPSQESSPETPEPPVPLPSLSSDLTGWRVSAGVRAERILQDVEALTDSRSTRAKDANDCVGDAIEVITRSQGYGWWDKLKRSWSGSDVENAWQRLKQAEENLLLAKHPAELRRDVPWLCEVARLSYPKSRAAELCLTLTGWVKHNDTPDGVLAADILAANHAQSNADHQQTRELRNILYTLTLILFAFDVIVWGLDLASATVLALGALGGALATVFAINKGSPVAPYNLALPQLLLKVVTGAAVAAAALPILSATLRTDLSSAEESMYALVFGFSQQLFTHLVDIRAAALKDAIAPKAEQTKENG